jgi:hypothetical protein
LCLVIPGTKHKSNQPMPCVHLRAQPCWHHPPMLWDHVPSCRSRIQSVGAMLHAVHMCPMHHKPTHSPSTPNTHWHQALRPRCSKWCGRDALRVACHVSKPFVRSRAFCFCIPIHVNPKQKREPPYLRPHLGVCYEKHMAVIPSSSRSRPCQKIGLVLTLV